MLCLAYRLRANRAVRGRSRASTDRDLVLLPGRRRRADHQDRRWPRRGFREGKSRHQGAADLLRLVSGVDHQGAHRSQGRRRADDGSAVVDRHVHADRRRRGRGVRYLHQDAGRPGVGKGLLPGVHGEQPDRRQDLGHPVPALDDRALLEQGDVQGSGARSEQGASDLGRDGLLCAEAHQARRVGQGHAMGRADPVVGISLLVVPGAHHRERRHPDEPRRNRNLLRQARRDRGAAILGRSGQQVQSASRGHRRVGHDAEGLLRAQDRDDVDDDRQSHQRAEQRQVRVRRGDAAREQAAG